MKTEPDSRIALEAAAKGNLENTVALLGVLDLSNIVHFIPDGGRGSIPVMVERIFAWLSMLRLQLEVLGNAINDSTTSRMYAPVFNATLEIRDISRDFGRNPIGENFDKFRRDPFFMQFKSLTHVLANFLLWRHGNA